MTGGHRALGVRRKSLGDGVFRFGVAPSRVEMLTPMYSRVWSSLCHNLVEGSVEYLYCSVLMLYEVQQDQSRTMTKWFYSTRLETRTKESTSIASVRVANLYAE